MNKDEVISNICKFSVNYKSVGSRSINDWVRDSGWLTHQGNISMKDIKEFLKSSPELIDSWLCYSSDKRTSSGWYFKENVEECSFVVGYFENKIGTTKEVKYLQSIDACAQFILNEFHHFHINSINK